MLSMTNFICKILPTSIFSLLEVSEDNELLSFVLLLLGVVCLFTVLFLIYKLILKFNARNVSDKNPQSNETYIAENTVNNNAGNDAEVIAAITAAIAMAESEDSDIKFRVVAFKRI